MSLEPPKERIGVINDVLTAVNLLAWDSRTMMPSGAGWTWRSATWRSQARPAPRDVLSGDFPPAEQMALPARLAAAIGYDFKRGRIDPTVHPFEISFTRDDVRITTRFKVQPSRAINGT